MAKFKTFKGTDGLPRTINVDYIYELENYDISGQGKMTKLKLKNGTHIIVKLSLEEIIKFIND
jgi:hypothetical protein